MTARVLPPPSPSVSSRSSEPNSVRYRQARLIHLRQDNPGGPKSLLVGSYFAGGCLSQSDFKIRYVVDFPRSGVKKLDCCLIGRNR
jgi:hypothetical protein